MAPWEPQGLAGEGLFPPDMVAEREEGHTVYFVIAHKMHGTEQHVQSLEDRLQDMIELKLGKDRTTLTRVKPDGGTIVLPD